MTRVRLSRILLFSRGDSMNLMRTDPLSFFSFYKIWKNCLMVLYIAKK